MPKVSCEITSKISVAQNNLFSLCSFNDVNTYYLELAYSLTDISSSHKK